MQGRADAGTPDAPKTPESGLRSVLNSSKKKTRTIRVKKAGQESLTLEVDEGATVEEIKEQIAAATGTPLKQQRLLFAGRMLQEGRTLYEQTRTPREKGGADTPASLTPGETPRAPAGAGGAMTAAGGTQAEAPARKVTMRTRVLHATKGRLVGEHRAGGKSMGVAIVEKSPHERALVIYDAQKRLVAEAVLTRGPASSTGMPERLDLPLRMDPHRPRILLVAGSKGGVHELEMHDEAACEELLHRAQLASLFHIGGGGTPPPNPHTPGFPADQPAPQHSREPIEISGRVPFTVMSRRAGMEGKGWIEQGSVSDVSADMTPHTRQPDTIAGLAGGQDLFQSDGKCMQSVQRSREEVDADVREAIAGTVNGLIWVVERRAQEPNSPASVYYPKVPTHTASGAETRAGTRSAVEARQGLVAGPWPGTFGGREIGSERGLVRGKTREEEENGAVCDGLVNGGAVRGWSVGEGSSEGREDVSPSSGSVSKAARVSEQLGLSHLWAGVDVSSTSPSSSGRGRDPSSGWQHVIVDETVGYAASKSGGEEQTWMKGVAAATQPQKARADGTESKGLWCGSGAVRTPAPDGNGDVFAKDDLGGVGQRGGEEDGQAWRAGEDKRLWREEACFRKKVEKEGGAVEKLREERDWHVAECERLRGLLWHEQEKTRTLEELVMSGRPGEEGSVGNGDAAEARDGQWCRENPRDASRVQGEGRLVLSRAKGESDEEPWARRAGMMSSMDRVEEGLAHLVLLGERNTAVLDQRLECVEERVRDSNSIVARMHEELHALRQGKAAADLAVEEVRREQLRQRGAWKEQFESQRRAAEKVIAHLRDELQRALSGRGGGVDAGARSAALPAVEHLADYGGRDSLVTSAGVGGHGQVRSALASRERAVSPSSAAEGLKEPMCNTMDVFGQQLQANGRADSHGAPVTAR